MGKTTGIKGPGTPLVLDIKGNSLDDGPGIRTVIFLKGCPLSCVWCHNPESKKAGVALSFEEEKCIGCGACVDACEFGALDRGRSGPDRASCSLCMACADVCPSTALKAVGEAMGIEALVAKVVRDRGFFSASGGGVTLSGGEPTLCPEFCGGLLARLKAEGIHTLIETCGYFSWGIFESSILPFVDTVYCDIKLINAEAHRRHCGLTNTLILKNIEKLFALSQAGSLDFLPRVPLVPEITATGENLRGIADFIKENGGQRVQLMAYNPLWHDKLKAMGFEDPLGTAGVMQRFMETDEVKRYSALFEGRGLEVV